MVKWWEGRVIMVEEVEESCCRVLRIRHWVLKS
jgi:hypothetical protein